MERKIRALYTITICAIIAFLGMQAYWLNSRYEYALTEYADALEGRVLTAFGEYYEQRRSLYNCLSCLDTMQRARFSLEQSYGDTVTTRRTATISTYVSNIREILGLASDDTITEEHRQKIVDLEIEKIIEPTSARIFDASNAPDENAAWVAARNVQIESRVPFSADGLNSAFCRRGIEARISLIAPDSMAWNHTATLKRSFLHPQLAMTVPYSQLEGKSAEIVCPFSFTDVLPGMTPTLICTVALSLLLILCLVWQFSVILRLNRLDKTRNDFVATMIHELKRPISTLKMCVSGIQNDRMMSQPELKTELVSETRSALDVLSAYFARLRDITFNNSTQIPLSTSNFCLSRLIEEAERKAASQTRKKVTFRNRLAPELSVCADRIHLGNILDNLIENALKYSGDIVEITISASDSSGAVVITVEDNGIGMSASDCRKAFDRFYRSEAASGLPGMGLGLAYVRLLAEAHGGSASVESREGKGSCFTITIPQ